MSASKPPQALVLNVTTVNSTASSYFTVYPGPAGRARPLASDLDFPAGLTVPNLVVVQIGSDGSINIFNFAGNSDALVDVFGYFS
jgi:hypothetical protein